MTDAQDPIIEQDYDAHPALQPGDTFGPYQIVGRIGEADTSAVWRAQNPQTGEDVVIRQLIPGSPLARERAFLERCEKEVRKQKALAGSVRRVVLLKALADDPRGAFLISDFASGASVEQLLNSRSDPFDLVRGLRIVHATAKVLDQLHKNDLIHGGLRPGSIVLRLSGGVQIIDTGITGLITEQEALSPEAARYMAPELFHGVAGDAKSDVYALGMIAYEMLAGRGAFEHVFGSVLGDKRSSAMRWMKWHTNARVSAPHLHELNPRVPVRLSDLVSRMMAKDRSKRIASAEQLLEAIQRHFGQDAIVKAEASPDAFTPSGAQIKATGPGDTTELPQRSKKPMVIGIAALIVVILVGGIWMTASTIKRKAYEQRRSLSTDALIEADQAYNSGRFEYAQTLYREQADNWPDRTDALGQHGRAGVFLTQAQIALTAGDFTAARSALFELDRMPEAGPANRDAVKTLSDEADRREAFGQSLAKAQEHMDAGEFAQARNIIRDVQSDDLTETESQALMEFQVRIDAQLETEEVNEAIARADELVEQKNLPSAINHLTTLQHRIQNPRLDEKIQSLNLLKQFQDKVTEGETAQNSGDYDKAVSAYEQALSLMDDQNLAASLMTLKSKAEVQRGKAMADSGNSAGAKAAFTSALAYDPANAEARGWLARMNVTIEKRSHVEAGRRAEASGDLVRAAGHYRAALQSEADEEVEAALNRVLAGSSLSRAEQLMIHGQFEQAGKELMEARRLQPDNPAVSEALERYDRRVRYRELIERGDAFTEQGRFGQAKQAYREAQNVLNTDEVVQRLDNTEFNHLLAQAKGFIANKQWSSARGILATAARIRITDELTELRKQVDQGLKEESSDSGGGDG